MVRSNLFLRLFGLFQGYFLLSAVCVVSQMPLAMAEDAPQGQSATEYRGTGDVSSVPTNALLKGALVMKQFSYAEELTAPHKSTESGLMVGPELQAHVSLGESFFMEGSFSIFAPELKYDGSTMSGRPVQSNGNHRFINADLLFGGTVFGQSSQVDAYGTRLQALAGPGFRHWHRGGSNKPGAIDYSEDYMWLPFYYGGDGQVQVGKRTSLGLRVLGSFSFYNRMQANMSDLDPGLNNPVVNMNGYYGAVVNPYFSQGILPNGRLFLSFQPSFEFYHFNESQSADLLYKGTPISRIYEPASNTYIYGATLSIGAAL